jgi:hypothetical protein
MYLIFTQKIVSKLSKLWIWEARSGIRKKPILDPEKKLFRIPGSKRHRSLDPDPQHSFRLNRNPISIPKPSFLLIFLSQITAVTVDQ